MKKYLSAFAACIIFAAVTLFACLTAFAQSADIEKTQLGSSDTYYSYDSASKTLTISGTGATPNFSNSSGTSNSQPWFSWRSDGSIEHIVVEEGVTSLGRYLFYCVSTADISLPSTLVSIDSYAMAGTNSNKNPILPKNLKSIGTYAFYYTSGLESVYIPFGVTSIGASAFENCTSLSSVEFGSWKMNTSIGTKAFFKCSSLAGVTVPKYASLSSYSFGYYAASAGSVYDSFKLYVYRDSKAYDYAVKGVIDYVLINESSIDEGDAVSCTYFDDSISSVMTFVFEPEVTAIYDFFSQSDIDLKCTLKNSNSVVLCENDDASAEDTDFRISYQLSAGQKYFYDVSSNSFTGDFTVKLMPHTISSIDSDLKQVELSAAEGVNGIFDIIPYAESSLITVIYDTGYTDSLSFLNNSMYYGNSVYYTDSQKEQKWFCAQHTGYICVGNAKASVDILINHSYTAEITEPTYSQPGYTAYTCVCCGDTYISDYVASLGVTVEGRVLLMEKPDGSHPHNYPLVNACVNIGGNTVAQTDSNGNFKITVDSTVKSIRLCSDFSIDREIAVIPDELGNASIGEVVLFCFDYNFDGYVNAKDFALLNSVMGEYPQEEYEYYIIIDYNQDGFIDDDDWIGAGAPEFYTCGKIDESIYNY